MFKPSAKVFAYFVACCYLKSNLIGRYIKSKYKLLDSKLLCEMTTVPRGRALMNCVDL